MKKVIKQVAGIDVAQKELAVCFGKVYDDLSLEKAVSEHLSTICRGMKTINFLVRDFFNGAGLSRINPENVTRLRMLTVGTGSTFCIARRLNEMPLALEKNL